MASSPARRRRVVALLALAASLALAAPAVDARPGGGGGMGSRGSKTFSAPPSTATSPGAMGPIQRSQTSPSPGFNNPGMAAQNRGSRFGGGFLGGGAYRGPGFGLGGILLIVLIVLLVTGRL